MIDRCFVLLRKITCLRKSSGWKRKGNDLGAQSAVNTRSGSFTHRGIFCFAECILSPPRLKCEVCLLSVCQSICTVCIFFVGADDELKTSVSRMGMKFFSEILWDEFKVHFDCAFVCVGQRPFPVAGSPELFENCFSINC